MDISERSVSSTSTISASGKNNNYVSNLLKRRDSFDKAGTTICRHIEFCLPKDCIPNVTDDMASGEFLMAKIVQEQKCSNQKDRILSFKKK